MGGGGLDGKGVRGFDGFGAEGIGLVERERGRAGQGRGISACVR